MHYIVFAASEIGDGSEQLLQLITFKINPICTDWLAQVATATIKCLQTIIISRFYQLKPGDQG